MSMARPVIAARVGQVAEVIEHGRTGWLYEPGDAAALAGAIRMLEQDRDLCGRLATAARERVLFKYTWQHNARRVIDIAEAAIAARRRAADRTPGPAAAIAAEA